MAEFIPLQIGRNMLAGQQGTQQIQESNQLAQMRQMQMQQAQEQQQRDATSRNELSAYLAGGSNGLAGLIQADPEKAMQVQNWQGQQSAAAAQQNELMRKQKVEQAKQSYAQAQGVINSDAPATYMRILLPEQAARWAEAQGKDVEDLTDEDASALAQRVSALAGSQAGMVPEYTNPEAGVDPTTGKDAFVRFEKTSGKPQVLGAAPRAQKPLVQVGVTEEKAEAKKVGEGMGEMYVNLQKSGAAAPMKLGKLDRMEQLMEGVTTGKLTPALTQVASIAESFGIKLDSKLGPKQALESLTNEMALELRNPSGGAGLPGAMSDSDRTFLSSMTAGLSKTKEGNKLIIQTARAVAKREQDVARLAREYRKKNGSLDEGFYDVLADFSEANPLFGKRGAPAVTPDGWIVTEKK